MDFCSQNTANSDVFVAAVDTGPSNSKSSRSIPQEILEDLCSRFLINIPEEERNDMVRMCFQIELAHWFYLDFYRQEDPELIGCGIKEFMQIVFRQFPFLLTTSEDINAIYGKWKQYKVKVPVFGAILLDETLEKCLLVQGFHTRVSWGFPKGKVNKDEEDFACAAREVREETGFDITPVADPGEYLEFNIHDHQVRLYVVPGVPSSTHFQPKTRGEIKEIKWFNVYHLPSHKKDLTPKEKIGLGPNSFFMVQPFVKPLRKWITKKNEQIMRIPLKPLTIPSYLTEENHSKEKEDDPSQEAYILKRRKEEQRIFQELHMLSHPLRSNHQENEEKLRKLLGMREQSGAQPEGNRSKEGSPRPALKKKPEDQPEAIRKLLTGTLQVSPNLSPVTTPDRQQMMRPNNQSNFDSLGNDEPTQTGQSKDFKKESYYKKGNRSNEKGSHRKQRDLPPRFQNQSARKSPGKGISEPSVPGSLRQGQILGNQSFQGSSVYSVQNIFPGSSGTARKILFAPTDDENIDISAARFPPVTYKEHFDLSTETSSALLHERRKKPKESQVNRTGSSLSDFYFNATPFVNFRFDREALLATLP